MIVELREVEKLYPGEPAVHAVRGINLNISEGGIFGLLGPNGAGKTTTIGICTTRVMPSRGQVHIAGRDVLKQPATVRRTIGVVTQYNTLDRSITVFENLYLHCRYFGFNAAAARERANELLKQFLLTDKAKAMPWALSGGLAQRVQIARSIAHRPSVLFLDEPSAGLDPQSRLTMWELVRGLRDQGITVVLTTHYMEEADALCDQLAIMDHGKILVCDAPHSLKSSIGSESIYRLELRDKSGAQQLVEEVCKLPQVQRAEVSAEGVRVFASAADGLLPQVVSAAAPYGLRDLTISKPTLEEVFIRLTGRELRD